MLLNWLLYHQEKFRKLSSSLKICFFVDFSSPGIIIFYIIQKYAPSWHFSAERILKNFKFLKNTFLSCLYHHQIKCWHLTPQKLFSKLNLRVLFFQIGDEFYLFQSNTWNIFWILLHDIFFFFKFLQSGVLKKLKKLEKKKWKKLKNTCVFLKMVLFHCFEV